MSNSSLVTYTQISPNSDNPRNNNIKKITIHHMAGNLSVERCGKTFSDPARKASANYGIDGDGNVGLYVDEANRAWTSSNAENDNQAVTIEVANDEIGGDWHVSDTAYNKLIELCVDICRRNGISRLNYTGDKSGNLTMHKWFAATACPGPYLSSKFQDIADTVNAALSGGAVATVASVSSSDELVPGYGNDPAAFIYQIDAGSSEEDKVKALQVALTLDGDAVSVDGRIGSETEAACKKHVLRVGSRGHCVVFVQRLLCPDAVDAKYGKNTRDCVIAWQSAEGKAPDGVVGVKTYRGLCLDSE